MKLLSDNPITTKAQDTFDYYPFVEILGKAILDTKDLPFTVGVFGEWGSGKTSLLRLLQQFVDKKKCKSVWFNPWKYDNKEELWAALIRSILLRIYQAKSSGEKLKERAWRLFKSIAWLTAKEAIPYATKGIISAPAVEDIKNAIVDRSKDEHEFLNKFEDKFKDLVRDHVGPKGRLVIFIDDLDRCVPENAITVLESLKLYLDGSACVFVLGMDRTVVELGIKHRYGESIQLSGREYLEKIIQLPFFLPPVQFGKLQETLQSKSDTADFTPEIWTLVRYGLGGNPRKAKRFVNSFYMAGQALDRPEILGEAIVPSDESVDKDDVQSYEPGFQLYYLAKVLIIQMNYTDFYDYLLFNPKGWKTYEQIRGGHIESKKTLNEDPDLARHWRDRRLNFFMDRTSGGDFPPPPSSFTLQNILRFTGLVERDPHLRESDEKSYAENQRARTKPSEATFTVPGSEYQPGEGEKMK